jgi:hypothetical protein
LPSTWAMLLAREVPPMRYSVLALTLCLVGCEPVQNFSPVLELRRLEKENGDHRATPMVVDPNIYLDGSSKHPLRDANRTSL